MAGYGGQVHKGWSRHVRWAREESWGELPPVPSWVCVPVQMGEMALRTVPELFSPLTSFGGWRRSALWPHTQRVTGDVLVLAWPQVTSYLLDAALARESDPLSPAYQDLHSYCIDHYTPPDPRRYRGVKVDRLEMHTGPAGLAVRLWLSGWKEEANDALTEDDFSYSALTPRPFRLRDATVTLDSGEVLDLEDFAITVDNHLEAGPGVAGHVAYLVAGQRTVRLEMAKLHLSDVLNAAVRGGSSLSFAALFTHPAGHELTLELPVLYASDNREEAPPDRLARSRAVLEAAADESGRDLIHEVRLLGATTTAI